MPADYRSFVCSDVHFRVSIDFDETNFENPEHIRFFALVNVSEDGC